MTPAQKAWQTRRRSAELPAATRALERKLRLAMTGAIRLARTRQAKRAATGKPAVAVTVTVDQLMAKLRANNYRCALTGLEFWNDDSDRFGPTLPSLDRIACNGPYSNSNLRVVLLGINSLRGRGSDADMDRICAARVARAGAVMRQLGT